MMVMEKELFDLYCKWLFKILFVLEPILDQMRLKGFQGRLYGRISEILFNVWLDHEIESGKIEKICMERVKWFKKSIAFLKAKFLGIKYESGF